MHCYISSLPLLCCISNKTSFKNLFKNLECTSLLFPCLLTAKHFIFNLHVPPQNYRFPLLLAGSCELNLDYSDSDIDTLLTKHLSIESGMQYNNTNEETNADVCHFHINRIILCYVANCFYHSTK